ncbi:MAG: reverse transcriptase/maturase family protein [Patescibacteria group bacterium]
MNLEETLLQLYQDLSVGSYKHGPYKDFYIEDPKRRHIFKAQVIDRILNHAIFRVLEPIFNKKFIHDSYSSRVEKGIHKAHDRFRRFAWRLSKNNMQIVWVLKCDIRKFFDSIDHDKLLEIISKTVKDEKAVELLKTILKSYSTNPRKGIPMGNVTSQLFSNIYLDQLDQYVKRDLKIKNYIRYADDFVILSRNKEELLQYLSIINIFLQEKLSLSLHPNKITIRKYNQGVDFLGFIIFPFHTLLRTRTRRRMLKNIKKLKIKYDSKEISEKTFNQSLSSYFGIIKHCQGFEIRAQIFNILQKTSI